MTLRKEHQKKKDVPAKGMTLEFLSFQAPHHADNFVLLIKVAFVFYTSK